jgi:hypothetical protein
MVYTPLQWDKIQSTMPQEDRVSYLEYIKIADPAQYKKLITPASTSSLLSKLKADAQKPAKTAIVDEQGKLAGAKTDTAAQKAAQKTATEVVPNFKASEAASAKTDSAASVSISAAESKVQARAAAAAQMKTDEEDERALLALQADIAAAYFAQDKLAADAKAAADAAAAAAANGSPNAAALQEAADAAAAAAAATAALAAGPDATTSAANAAAETILGTDPAEEARIAAEKAELAAQQAATDAAAAAAQKEADRLAALAAEATDAAEKTRLEAEAKAAQEAADAAAEAAAATETALAEKDAETAAAVAAAAAAQEAAGTAGKQPGAAWILNADKTKWIKPTMPTEAGKGFSWDDEKGWIAFTVGTSASTSTASTSTASTSTASTSTASTSTASTSTASTSTASSGFTQKDIDDAVAAALAKASETTADRDKKANALASLTSRFSQYGLESLIPKIRELVISGATEATISLELAETEEYKKRFKANADRLKKGLSVLDAGTYIGMEDSYRQALRAYGLKQFDTDEYVSQFIANDISANELSNRIVTAVQRVQNADPAITSQLKEFYNIGQNDLVAYVLDPNQQFQRIERQVQAAEIGVAARRQGLQTGVGVAEQLAAQGVTQAEAQKGYATIADILPDAKKLSDIYGTTLEGYDLGQAEQEVFNQLASAQRRRQKLSAREVAAFSGSSGTNKTSLTQSKVGKF